MFNKLRDRTGKHFVQKYSGGGLTPEEKQAKRQDNRDARAANRAEAAAKLQDDMAYQIATGFGGQAQGSLSSAASNFAVGNWKTGIMDTAVAGMKIADNLAMGDKNFDAQSEAIDGAVHGVSGALMKSGNPYAMAAGAVLEGVNFISKAGGQTVQGFDVGIDSSGYGSMGHMDSSSSRSIPFLGGLVGQDKIQEKLTKRNTQMQMAMQAANIANEQKFEQEARANSIQNTIMNNNIALAGGLDTSLLGG